MEDLLSNPLGWSLAIAILSTLYTVDRQLNQIDVRMRVCEKRKENLIFFEDVDMLLIAPLQIFYTASEFTFLFIIKKYTSQFYS